MSWCRICRASTLVWAAVIIGWIAACASGTAHLDHRNAPSRAIAQEIRTATESPALALAVVVNGRIVLNEAFGERDLASGQRATADTTFRIGSVSKLFTSLALAQLIQRGRIALDDPVASYVPEFPHKKTTIGQLARHLGGIRHYGRAEYINNTHYASVRAAVDKFIDDPLVAPPGEKYVYSSYGYNLLGAALENVSGRSFTELIKREVLTPFGMRATDVAGTQVASAATFYWKGRDGVVTVAPSVDLSDRLPSGGYESTAADLSRFLAGVIRLPQPARDLLFQPGQTSSGASTGVGFAWRIGTDASGRQYVHHGGESIGGRAFVLAYPQQEIGVVLLSNLSFAQFGEKEAVRIAQLYLDPLTVEKTIEPKI